MHSAVQKEISKGTNVNSINERGLSALHIACESGQLAVVKVLVEASAALDGREGQAQATPLLAATLITRSDAFFVSQTV